MSSPYIAPNATVCRVASRGLGNVLLGFFVVVWAGAASLAFVGSPEAAAKLIVAIGYSRSLMLVAGLVTCCLLGMLALDRRAVLAGDAERRARRTSDLLYRVLDAFPLSVQIKTADLHYVWVNEEFLKRTGSSNADLVGNKLEDLGFDPILTAAVIAHDRRVLASGQVEGPGEQVIRRPDGGLVHIGLVTKVPLFKNGKISHIVTVGADLSALHEAQLRAEELRRLLETIMDAAPIAMQVKDRDLRIRWANRAYCEHVGILTDPPIGKTFAEVSRNPDIVASATAGDLEVFSTGKPVQFERHFPANGDRSDRHFLVTKLPIRDTAGEIVQILTLGTDVTALKRAKFEADTANRLVEGILRNVPLSIQVKDTALRYCWVNRTFSEAVREDPETLLGKTLDDLDLPAEAAMRTHRQDRAVLANGKTIRFENQSVIHGVVRHMMNIKAPLLDAAGRTTHVITIGADITEQNRLRTEADNARRRLQVILDALPVTIALKDTDRRFQWVNREFENVHGSPATTVMGRRAEEFVADKALTDEVAQADFALLATGLEMPPLQQRHVSACGDTREYSVRRLAVRDAEGEIEGILVVGVDMTDLLRATTALRRLNEELESRVAERANELIKANELVATVIESSSVPIVTFRLDGSIRGWNPAAAKVMGFSEMEAMSGLIPTRSPEEQAQFTEMSRLIMRGESFSGFEARHRHKDGREIELLISGAPLRRADGTIEGAVGIWLDVTEQRATERQLRQSQKMEAVGQLTGGVAHDFNNLLAVVIGNLELLSVSPNGDDQELVREAIEAAERGAALTKRLLAFARQQTLQPIATNIGDLVVDMEPLLQRAVGEAVAIECASIDDLWLARVDPSQLESAILNLSVNARDAMPAGGKLKITMCNVVLNMNHPDWNADMAAGDYVSLCVSDTGVGIAPEIIGKVFEPFFTTKMAGKGSGLGLSMVFGFVKQSGGQVSICSELGIGTRITLYLPRDAGAIASCPAVKPVVDGRGETILLVEDNPQLRRTSIRAVTALGYRVVAAEDASTALALLEEHAEISLLFSDVVLPGATNGFDLALVARRRRPGLPVLFTSGFVDPSMVYDSSLVCDSVILTKPFRRGELAEKLRAALEAVSR